MATNGEVCEKRLDMLSRHVQRMNPFPSRIPMESEEPLDPAHVGFLRPRGVVLGQARFVDLIEQLHGCRMTCADTNVNTRG